MEKNIKQLIADISIDHGFFPLDIAECYEQNSEYIDGITDVFQFRSEKDEAVVETACEVLCQSFGNFNSLFDLKKESTDEQKLLVITAFMENSRFFSMCWNWMMMEKHGSSAASANVRNIDWNAVAYKSVYDYQEYKAAGSSGMKKFGKENPIAGFGVFGQMCDNEDGEYQFYINLTDEAAVKSFTIEIEFMNSDVKYNASIISTGDGTKILHSDSVEVTDIFGGVRNLIIKVLPKA